MPGLELWGGCECTVNRVGETYMDQTLRSGHENRIGDLDRIAALGIKAIRYPVLWERISPRNPNTADWRWTDDRLARLRELGVRPIAGLMHHGSGPRYTSLLDPLLPLGLAGHARAAAERYPWIEEWTPVNEPLTTARFAALYGHWHPHKRSETLFWTALVNQIDAVRMAMRQIREVNPSARLIQTEDLGRTYSTRAMAHQADYDNARRWMTWDLLTGRVTAEHPLFERLSRFGLGDRLKAIADDPCPPDVVGVNHYLTSDRFLDHRCDRYPPDRCGRNEFMAYADVEAIRVVLPAPGGLAGALEEAWARYGLPLAVTEAHNGCTREDQMRWLLEAWETAERLRARGGDVRAVTAWSLLGAYDWNSLLTRAAGHYEPGAFDLRAPGPRPTAVASLLRGIAEGGPLHPVAAGQGWWRRDVRLQFLPVFRTVDAPEARSEWRSQRATQRPLLIRGEAGVLGKALARACEWRGLDYVLSDMARPGDAWAVVDARNPQDIRSGKLRVRTQALFSPYDPENFASALVRKLARGQTVFAPLDELVQPTYTPDLVDAVLDLVIDGEEGEWPLTHGETVTWVEFARMIARALNLDERLVRPIAKLGEPTPPLPANERGWIMPSLENAVQRYAAVLGEADFEAEAEARIDRMVNEEKSPLSRP